MNYFQGNKNHPQHLSVAAVLMNDKGEICVHHLNQTNPLKGYWTDQGIIDAYLLMRETPEPGESLEQTLHRGLLEEFGATAEIKDYIGSIQSHFKNEGVEIEKTTIYFLCSLKDQDLSKRSGDIESKTDLEWHTKEFLIPKMKEQSTKYGRTDVDESSILEKLN